MKIKISKKLNILTSCLMISTVMAAEPNHLETNKRPREDTLLALNPRPLKQQKLSPETKSSAQQIEIDKTKATILKLSEKEGSRVLVAPLLKKLSLTERINWWYDLEESTLQNSMPATSRLFKFLTQDILELSKNEQEIECLIILNKDKLKGPFNNATIIGEDLTFSDWEVLKKNPYIRDLTICSDAKYTESFGYTLSLLNLLHTNKVIKKLTLKNMPENIYIMLNYLIDNSSLTELVVENYEIPHQLSADFSNLARSNVKLPEIRQSFYTSLGKNQSITKLSLTEMLPADELPSFFKGLLNGNMMPLQSLYIYGGNKVRGTAIGDESVTHFAHFLRTNRSLQILEIPQGYINDIGFTIILSALRNNISLQSLMLPYNNLTNTRTLLELVKTNKTLKHINLSHNQITPASLALTEEILNENPLLHLCILDQSQGKVVVPGYQAEMQNIATRLKGRFGSRIS